MTYNDLINDVDEIDKVDKSKVKTSYKLHVGMGYPNLLKLYRAGETTKYLNSLKELMFDK